MTISSKRRLTSTVAVPAFLIAVLTGLAPASAQTRYTTTSSGCSCALSGAGRSNAAAAFPLLGLAVLAVLSRRRR
jgi:MYXO-CTERM domain-containing protein